MKLKRIKGVMSCGKCGDNLPPVGDYILCGECKEGYHYECGGVKESVYRKMGAEKRQQWKCPHKCRGQVSMFVKSPDLTPELPVSLQDVFNKLTLMTQDLRSLTKSFEFLSKQYDDLKVEMKVVNDRCREEVLRVQKLETENKLLHQELKTIKLSLNNFDQNNRNKTIEIHGVEEKKDEDLKEVMSEMAQMLKIGSYNVNKVENAHRRYQKNQNRKSNPIIVKFLSKCESDEWLAKRRTGLTNKNLWKGGNDEQIFINENLTPFNRELAWRARVSAKKHGYKYSWVKNGNIFMKKSDTDPVRKITTIEDVPGYQLVESATKQ